MNVLSVCSGAGGLDIGLEAAGATVVGLCEIHPPARAVLAHRWPTVPLWDDLTTLNGADWNGRVDLVAGGTPCTDLSVAGGRAGLGGEHSRIYWDFCRVADQSAARWILWENVRGALSSNGGADFASVLWGLSGLRPDVPANGWRSIGVCVGPRRAVVWRMLDARWFGVAQRRRRVFALACPVADVGRAIEVLLEPDSLSRHPQPCAPSGEEPAATLGGGSGSRGWPADTDRMTFVARVSHGDYRVAEVASTLRRRSGDDGTSSDLVAFNATQDTIWSTKYFGSLTDQGAAVALPAPVVFRGRDGGSAAELGEPEVSNTLRASIGGTAQSAVLTTALRVRRLLPVECERLMGWPDDWTRYGPEGTEIADSHRYAMCGNGVVAPQAAWIGRRLIAAHRGGRS